MFSETVGNLNHGRTFRGRLRYIFSLDVHIKHVNSLRTGEKANFQNLSINVTTSGRNCNTMFDVLTSKMPNADRSKHAIVCRGDFVLIKSEHQNK